MARILSGEKRVELRRVRPDVQPGASVVFYQTAPISAVVAQATVVEILTAAPTRLWSLVGADSGCARDAFLAYFADREIGCAIRFRDVLPREKPLGFRTLARAAAGFRPPQSIHYLSPSRSRDRRILRLVGLPTLAPEACSKD